MYSKNYINVKSVDCNQKSKKTIKIAMFTDVLRENIDGVSNTIFNFLNHIPKNRFEFLFITPYPPESSFRYSVIRSPYITLPLNKTYRLAIPYFLKSLKQEIDDFRPDLIHFTTPSFLGFYAVKYAKLNNLPLIGTYHTHFAAYVKYYLKFPLKLSVIIQNLVWKITKWFYNKCDAALVPTWPIRDEMINAGIDEHRLFIWGRGVDHSLFNPVKRDTGYMDNIAGIGKKKILFVSRIVMEKDLEILIGVYNYFMKTMIKAVFVVTGDGPKLGYLKKKMPNAVFTGSYIREDLAKIYASCDVFVFPSVTETFGNVVLEAMASGLPVVAAAKGGPMGIIKDGETGLLAKPGDSADFYAKIIYLLNNKEHAKQISVRAREYALKQKWNFLSAEVLGYYEKLTNIHKQKINKK